MKINIFRKQNLGARTAAVVCAVILMGFALSWLFLIDMGADPFTAMNRAISSRLGMSIGNWQLILNTAMFLIVLLFGGEDIGIGTVANMVLVGYSIDFFSQIWAGLLPAELGSNPYARPVILVLALLVFVLSAAVYMDVKLGASPYDALPFILARQIHRLPFRLVRILYDFAAIAIGCAFGAKLQPVTVLMALLLGPAVTFVARAGSKYFPKILGAED